MAAVRNIKTAADGQRSRRLPRFAFARSLVGVIAAAVLRGQDVAAATAEAADRTETAEIRALADRLSSLSPHVDRAEARRVAEAAVTGARSLGREYAVVGPPLFHNFLVNARVKKRGLCFQWTEDLMAQLASLRVRTLQLHWGDARAATWREHNCVVVTAKGQPFESGVVLDGWRRSGRLFWESVRADHYPWVEADVRCPHRQRQSHTAGVPTVRRL